MEAGRRSPKPDLRQQITDEAFRFDFFQLVYLLEHWVRRPAGADAAASPQVAIGHGGPLADEGIRLRPDPRLIFSPADVRRLEWLPARPEEADEDIGAARWEHPDAIQRRGKAVYAEDEVARVDINFMGLYGVSAPGPLYFSELINDPMVEEVPHLRNFLDLFNHRMLSFYYRAWQKYRYPYRYEPGAQDDFSAYILAFAGLREAATRFQTHLHVPRLIKYVGLLSMRTRPLAALRPLLADYFRDVLADDTDSDDDLVTHRQSQDALDRVRIRPWMLRWVELDDEGQNRVGARNCRLGEDMTLGASIPERSSKFRIRLGPLSWNAYQRLLPSREPFRQLCALTRLWVGEAFDFDFEMVLRRQDVPEAQMGGSAPGGAAQLGWTTWVTSGPGVDQDPSIIFPRLSIPKISARTP